MLYKVCNSSKRIIKQFVSYSDASNYYDKYKKRGWYINWQPNSSKTR